MRKPVRVIAIFLLGSLGFVGCAFKKDAGKRADEPSPAPVSVPLPALPPAYDEMTLDELKIEVVETPVFNKYFVEFTWPQEKKIRVKVRYGQTIVVGEADRLHRIQIPIEGRETKEFDISLLNLAGGEVAAGIVKRTAPWDWEIDGHVELQKSESYELNRILLTQRAVVLVGVNNLVIIAKQLHANLGARIVTVDRRRLAAKEAELEGANILLKAGKASGFLAIYMIGVDGNVGRSGADKEFELGPPEQPPAEYLAGKDGQMLKADPDPLDYSDPKYKGTGYPPPAIFSNLPILSKVSKMMIGRFDQCPGIFYPPTDGRDGSPGWSGDRGQKGGSTGNLSVHIGHVNGSFDLDIYQRPGLPGPGGRGGPGGKGGPGGRSPRPGDAACPPGKTGARGPVGARGGVGAPGQLGKIEIEPKQMNRRITIRPAQEDQILPD